MSQARFFSRGQRALTYAVTALVLLVSLFPILWVFVSSLKADPPISLIDA